MVFPRLGDNDMGKTRDVEEVEAALKVCEDLLSRDTITDPELKKMIEDRKYMLEWFLLKRDWGFLKTYKALLHNKQQ